MGAPRIGTRVVEGTRVGVVVDHRPQGMVDVCFEDSGLVERRPEGQLLTLNPAAKRAVAPSGRGKAAPAPAADIYDPAEEQRRAVVRGIYESLVAKRLGMPLAQYKALRDMGLHPDLAAAERGTITQREFRAFVDKAQRLSIGVGRKQGYVSHTGKQPTPAGAAIAYARYGADPTVVQRLAKGHARALELAKEKNAAALAKNRELYEIMLMLARKEQTPRVVEEIVGGKLVSFQQPGAKRVFRGRNPWKPPEERGRARGMEDFPTKMVPYLEDARSLGKQKGQALRQLAQVRKEAAKKTLANALAQIETAFQKVSKDATDTLGLDALDDRGLLRSQVRHALGVLRKVHEDTASEVQRGVPVRNPVKQRTKGIGIVGVGYHWKDIKTSRKEFTPVTLSATPPVLDPDGVGFFLITFDSRRKDVERALQQAKGWRFVRNISSTEYTVGVATEAPQIHKVLRYQGGGAAAKRGVGGQFGKGLYTVVGPRVPKRKDPPLFERKADATEYARTLDLKAVSFQVPQVHEIVQLSNGYYEVRGPRAEEEIAIRVERNKKRDERDAAPSEYENEDLLYEDEGEAQRVAESLDYREAMRGALPIKGYRTAPGMDGKKAVETYNRTLVALEENRIPFVLDPTVASVGQATGAAQKRLSERAPERLIATAVARGEDVDVLLPLISEAEERGRNKLVNLLAKSYEEDATKVALKAASKKLGAVKVAGILSAPRDEVSMKARMPGAFVQPARAFGKQRRVSFKKQASDLDVVLAALYPKGDAPPTLLPKYDRDHLRDLDDEALAKLAKSKLGMSDKDIEKVLTSVERSVLSKIVAEQAPESTIGLVGRGGFNVELPKKEAKRLAQQTAQLPKGPKPLRPTALREKAEKARVEDRMAELDREIAELKAQMAAQQRKKNGALSVGVSAGLRAAKAGGQVAARYGKKAYSAARAWLSTGAGQKFVGEVSGIAVALFGAKAVSSGKLTREQAALVQHELERQTGRKADPARVAVALQIADPARVAVALQIAGE